MLAHAARSLLRRLCATARVLPTARTHAIGESALAAPFRDCLQVAGRSGVATVLRARMHRRRPPSQVPLRCQQPPRLSLSVRPRCSACCIDQIFVPPTPARIVRSTHSLAQPARRARQRRHCAKRPWQRAALRVRRAHIRAARAAGSPATAATDRPPSVPRYSSAGAAPRAAVRSGMPTAARIFASISAASSGCSFRYSRVLSLPWPILLP